MNKAQVKMFEELLADKDFKGKKWMRYLLWLNTTKPKFKIGECFEVTDRGHRIFGYPVKDFKGKITNVNSLLCEHEWRYELEVECECNGKMCSAKVYKSESELWQCKSCSDNKNILGAAKSEHADELLV